MSLSRHGADRHTPDNERDHDTSQLELQARAAYAVLIRPPPVNGNRQQNGQAYDSRSSVQAYTPNPRDLAGTAPQPSSSIHRSPLYDQTKPVYGVSSGGEHARYDDQFQSIDSPSSSTDSQTVDLSLLAAEDRRRRNTEASARFRSKKKERLETIEQNMTVLQRRAENLEKEAVELRRENGWLKEMVIMKGKRGGQGNHSITEKGGPNDEDE
ncbi:hypothetical protein FRB91_000927 [Serendipita sp. 411]|nr:hypothetical protein FRB91_000927 [Serendipita sp. 411]